jgi:hypothetical protein
MVVPPRFTILEIAFNMEESSRTIQLRLIDTALGRPVRG